MPNILQPVLNGIYQAWRDIGNGIHAPVVAIQEPALHRDAFHRERVSNPEFAFDAQFTYDLHPYLFEQTATGSGASVAHDTTNRCVLFTFASTPTGGEASMQSYEWIPYQPGRSQLAFITGNFREVTANCRKWIGLGDTSNGLFLEANNGAVRVALYSDAGVGDRFFTTASEEWTDALDGTGPSGKTVDWTKEQIVIIDIQALYVGEVRMALDIDGEPVPFLTVANANKQAYPYIQRATLPVSVGMSCTGTVSTTMHFVCCSVITEGGAFDLIGYPGTALSPNDIGTTTGAWAHVISIRPKTTFNSITNRAKFVLENIDAMATAGSSGMYIRLALGQAFSVAPTWASAGDQSCFEIGTGGTLSGEPAYSKYTLFVPASGSKPSVDRQHRNRLPIALTKAGAVHTNGVLTLLAKSVSGTPNLMANLNWREIR